MSYCERDALTGKFMMHYLPRFPKSNCALHRIAAMFVVWNEAERFSFGRLAVRFGVS